MSIEMAELLPRGVTLESLPEAHQKNLLQFLPKLQAFRQKCGLPMVCTSGYRTLQHHLEIYRLKNEQRERSGFDPIPIPMGSKHLIGMAADFEDPQRKLALFVNLHADFIASLGFHFEAQGATAFPSPWLHIQCVAPASGKLWFWP